MRSGEWWRRCSIRSGAARTPAASRCGWPEAAAPLIHGALAVEGARLALGGRARSSAKAAEHWTARFMVTSYGEWLVLAAALGLLGYGLYQAYRALGDHLTRHCEGSSLTRWGRRWALRVARVGTAARAVVFLIVGGFLVKAVLEHDPRQATGVAEALDILRRQPYGPWLLGLLALGLIAYAADQVIQARYRRIRTS